MTSGIQAMEDENDAAWSVDRSYNCKSCNMPLHLPGYCHDCATTKPPKFVVKLPKFTLHDDHYGTCVLLDEVINAIRAAGGTIANNDSDDWKETQ
jgi:hypothetical protein